MITSQTKYVLTGGPGTGKTTLLKALRQHGYQTVPEVATLVVQEFLKKGPLPKWNSKNTTEFQKIFLKISATLEQKINKSSICFLDRSVIDTIAYCKMYNNKPLKELLCKAKNLNLSKVFYLDFLAIYKNTSVRQESFDVAQKAHKLIKETYLEYGYTVTNVPADSVLKRLQFIKDNIPYQHIFKKNHLARSKFNNKKIIY